ncbi:MAG: hypothetical protein JXB49_08045 [Bacteroidales bacterium]|nr:hypothetical protein [Bacteroidales bacterium]
MLNKSAVINRGKLLCKLRDIGFCIIFILLPISEIGGLLYLDHISIVSPVYDNNLLVKIQVFDLARQAYNLFWSIIGFLTYIAILTFSFVYTSKKSFFTLEIISIKVFLPLLCFGLILFTFQYIKNYSYKTDISYEKNTRELILIKSYLFTSKNKKIIHIEENYWLEMDHYDDGQMGSDKSPDIGRCSIAFQYEQAIIVFEGTPKLALSICNYLNEMTGMCSLQFFWEGRVLQSCRLLNSGLYSNCSCD